MCKKCSQRVIAFIVVAYAIVLTGYITYQQVYESGAMYGYQRAIQDLK